MFLLVLQVEKFLVLYPSPTVNKIDGYAVPNPNGTNTVLTYNDGYLSGAGYGAFIPSGDLSGSSSYQKVIGLDGYSLPTLTTYPSYFNWNGSGWNLSRAATTTLNVLNFGADPTGVNDSFNAFAACVTVKESIGGCDIFVPAGTYKLSQSLDIGFTPGKLYGVGVGSGDGDGTTIVSLVTAGSAITLAKNQVNGSGSYVTLEDIGIFSTFVPGSSIYPVSGPTGVTIGPAGVVTPFGVATLKNVLVSGWGVGFDPGSVEESVFYNVWATHCTIGIMIDESPTSNVFISCKTTQCGIGVKLVSGANIDFIGGAHQANQVSGILLAPTASSGAAVVENIKFDSVWHEQNVVDITANLSYAAGSNIAEIDNVVWDNCRFGGNSSGASNFTFVNPIVPTNALLTFKFARSYCRGMNLTIPSYASGVLLEGTVFNSLTDNTTDTTIINCQVPSSGPVAPKVNGIPIVMIPSGSSAPPGTLIATLGSSQSLSIPLPASCVALYDASTLPNGNATWADSSGHANSALAPITLGQTFLVSNVLGRPAVFSSGTSPLAYTSNLTGITGGNGLFIWVAYASLGRIGNDYTALFGPDSGGGFLRCFVGSPSFTTADYLQVQNSGGAAASLAAGTNPWRVITAASYSSKGTTVSVALNNGTATTGTGTSTTFTNGPLVVGGPDFNGWIFAALVCNDVPTSGELSALEVAATHIWGM